VNIFGIGLPEMAVIMVVALNLWLKAARDGRSMGKAMRSFQEASGSLKPSLSAGRAAGANCEDDRSAETKQIEAADSENHAATPTQQS